MADQEEETIHGDSDQAWNDSSRSKQVEMDALLALMWQEIEDRRAAQMLHREEMRKMEKKEEEEEKKEEG